MSREGEREAEAGDGERARMRACVRACVRVCAPSTHEPDFSPAGPAAQPAGGAAQPRRPRGAAGRLYSQLYSFVRACWRAAVCVRVCVQAGLRAGGRSGVRANLSTSLGSSVASGPACWSSATTQCARWISSPLVYMTPLDALKAPSPANTASVFPVWFPPPRRRSCSMSSPRQRLSPTLSPPPPTSILSRCRPCPSPTRVLHSANWSYERTPRPIRRGRSRELALKAED